ncbi:monofunctional biosynthetic peptidoglycan transglycosylase [Frigidibacter sp. MR17.24]|uniref:monofunctional biosynthetic peptidoglycan transglycosylase n=1 Tax=Frigidibacter sp. MR17.24 TaxID=3127345 RepID=UPI003012AB93
MAGRQGDRQAGRTTDARGSGGRRAKRDGGKTGGKSGGKGGAAPAVAAPALRPKGGWKRWFRRWLLRVVVVLALVLLALRFVNPVWTPYMFAERLRLGQLQHDWVAMDRIAPVMARSVVAAEDANFCLHWGFDMAAIRDALDRGAQRGASTLSQQVAKNVFLWQGRSWPRKALEAVLTPAVETFWSKRRILEIYLNVAEMGDGVFGVEAAARHYFGVSAAELTPRQAARLAAVLPAPKERDAARPSNWLERRARGIEDGAATIRADGRAACFEPEPL